MYMYTCNYNYYTIIIMFYIHVQLLYCFLPLLHLLADTESTRTIQTWIITHKVSVHCTSVSNIHVCMCFNPVTPTLYWWTTTVWSCRSLQTVPKRNNSVNHSIVHVILCPIYKVCRIYFLTCTNFRVFKSILSLT